MRPRLGDPSPRGHRHRRNRFLRYAVPLTFVALIFGVIFGVKFFLQQDPPNASKNPTGKAAQKESAKRILPEDNGNSFDDLVGGNPTQTLPVGDQPMPDISKGQNELVVEAPTIDGGIVALKVLEDFLAMKSLAERLPHLETKRPEPELASSPLAGPLPEVLKITVDIRETNAMEKLVDYYYWVDFANDKGGSDPQTMLVRTRGTEPPKVVVDPFLDLFGGRFERFASQPVKESGTFQVIISAGAFCYDAVPQAEKKYTLKILAREDAKEIAKAYFGKASNIGYMLEDESSGLAYGQAKACTVFMRWNMDDDPDKPYLEALDIKALNWNP